jgi:hypothetical protein
MTIAFFTLTLAGKSQTVDEIISKYVQAIGGKEKFSKITSMYTESMVDVMGNQSSSSMVILNGKGAKIAMDVMGQKMIQCYTDSSGWVINPMAGSSDAVDMPADQYNAGKSQIYLMDALGDYATRKYKAELLPSEEVGTVKAYKIKLTSPENITFNYFIDPSSYYVIKMNMSGNMMGQEVTVTNTLSDYRQTTEGIFIPYKVEVDYGGQFSLVINTKKVEFNKPVDESIFKIGNTNL